MSAPTARPVKRRRLLKYGLGGAALAAAGGVGVGVYAFKSFKINTIDKVKFGNTLRVPELAASQLNDDGRRVFDLQLATGSREFKPGRATRTWGVNGDYLGPTLRAARGETVLVNVRNSLDADSSLHWHGMHLPAKMDGGPHQPVAAGDTWSPHWTIDQPAASLWYHPHPHGATAQHVYRGLAGMFIVDDDDEAALDLPREYGVDDLPVIVQDRNFDGDNQFDESTRLISNTGILGDEILVNGTLAPYFEVTTTRVRLRLLNGSNARVYRFGFSDDRPFAVIGSDGGLLSAPHATRRIQMSPGERVEIVVEFEPGETVVLRSYPPDLQTDFFESRPHGGDDSFDILQFRVAADCTQSPPVPKSLVEVPRMEVEDAVTTREFELAGFTINGDAMDMAHVNFAARVDSTEIWEIINGDYSIHNFHVHDVQFQILSIGGQDPPPHLAGWKDTVQLYGGAPVRIALRFKDFADPDMPYMYHCHFLYHEDSGLMGQFVVLEEGQEIGTPPATQDHGGHSG